MRNTNNKSADNHIVLYETRIDIPTIKSKAHLLGVLAFKDLGKRQNNISLHLKERDEFTNTTT
jgi:hypothetical protein